MIAHDQLFQFSRFLAHAGIDGNAAYLDDLHKMRAVLGSAPHGFPWWTAVLLSLLLLVWFAGLAWGWGHLNRRGLRQRAPAHDAPGGSDAGAATSAMSS